MRMIESTGVELRGADVVCVGASTIVGRPVAVLLMEAEATVLSTNVHTRDLAGRTRTADVVITAAGVPDLLTGDMIKPGAVVIDVGINRVIDSETGSKKTVGECACRLSAARGWLPEPCARGRGADDRRNAAPQHRCSCRLTGSSFDAQAPVSRRKPNRGLTGTSSPLTSNTG